MLTINWGTFNPPAIDPIVLKTEITERFIKKNLLLGWFILGPIHDTDEDVISWVVNCAEKEHSFVFSVPLFDFVRTPEKAIECAHKLVDEIHAVETSFTVPEMFNMSKEEWEKRVEEADNRVRFDGETAISDIQGVARELYKREQEEQHKIILPS